MRKYNMYDPKVIEIIINEMVLKYNIDFNYLIGLPNGKIENKYWYEYYTFDSEEEYTKWKNFSIDFLSKNVTPKPNKKRINRLFREIDLMWGLKRNY